MEATAVLHVHKTLCSYFNMLVVQCCPLMLPQDRHHKDGGDFGVVMCHYYLGSHLGCKKNIFMKKNILLKGLHFYFTVKQKDYCTKLQLIYIVKHAIYRYSKFCL